MIDDHNGAIDPNEHVQLWQDSLGSVTLASDVRGVEMTSFEATTSPQGAGEAANTAAHCWAVIPFVMTGALMAPEWLAASGLNKTWQVVLLLYSHITSSNNHINLTTDV
jgi:hypothetical protein